MRFPRRRDWFAEADVPRRLKEPSRHLDPQSPAVLIPTQGFRHAATLQLTSSVRAIPVDASSEAIRVALERVAHELVALADDMRAPGSAFEWLTNEFNTTVDRLPHAIERDRIKLTAAAILARVASRAPDTQTRDLFLIYVPEDRLPVAAPLAIELTKRRVSVAFADYEVAAAHQLANTLAHGLDRHRGGAVLWTKAFERTHGQPPPSLHDRVRILPGADNYSIATDLATWANKLKIRDVLK
jgi:hypothetical protein